MMRQNFLTLMNSYYMMTNKKLGITLPSMKFLGQMRLPLQNESNHKKLSMQVFWIKEQLQYPIRQAKILSQQTRFSSKTVLKNHHQKRSNQGNLFEMQVSTQ